MENRLICEQCEELKRQVKSLQRLHDVDKTTFLALLRQKDDELKLVGKALGQANSELMKSEQMRVWKGRN